MSNPPRRPSRHNGPTPRAGRQHPVLGYWMPLIVTGALAIGGLAAWVWSERSENGEDDDLHDGKPQQRPPGAPRPPSHQSQGVGASLTQPGSSGGPPERPPGGEAASYYGPSGGSRHVDAPPHEDGTWYDRVQGVVRRTPSPQQFFESASKQVSAGFAAAGAALGSIVEEGGDDEYTDDSGKGRRSRDRRDEIRDASQREGFSDHERWSEEAEERTKAGSVEAGSKQRAETVKGKSRGKKTVAIVLSAHALESSDERQLGYKTEHASILSHLPTHQAESADVEIYTLIYSPSLQSLPPMDYAPNGGSKSISSSYSAISGPGQSPGPEMTRLSPRVDTRQEDEEPPTPAFNALYNQSLALVSSPANILPFTTPQGYVYILRHLAPQLVYVSDALAGDEGATLEMLKGWVGHTILVAGDEGMGGLVETETETEDESHRERKRWYDRSSIVGLGKSVEVVDIGRVSEDWSRRIVGKE